MINKKLDIVNWIFIINQNIKYIQQWNLSYVIMAWLILPPVNSYINELVSYSVVYG